MNRWREGLRQLRKYPSAVAGTAIILLLLGISVYAVVAIPYNQALELWRGGDVWQQHPVNARPAWVDSITGGNQPRTRVVRADDDAIVEQQLPGARRISMPLAFEHDADGFPSELNVFVSADVAASGAFVRLTWITPDERELSLGGRRISGDQRISLSQDLDLERRLQAVPHIGLFARPGGAQTGGAQSGSAQSGSAQSGRDQAPELLRGEYELRVDAIVFDADDEIDAELVVYGRVHGLAGTDHQRRDLMVALLWGTPIALAFGLLAAVGTTVTTLIIAAIGVWYRGMVDAVIQRLTEVNMILPLLPILVMIGTLYSTSIWVMLGVVILLGIFSAGIKMYRAMLLPIREAPYIEAAQAYGAGNLRIVMRYMIPRILPVLIPTFVTLIPTFVFLEASLALLGLGDPELPTWGKVLNDAQTQSALYHGFFYWVLSPAGLLMLTGLGFAMLGFALDRVFNPRLRKI